MQYAKPVDMQMMKCIQDDVHNDAENKQIRYIELDMYICFGVLMCQIVYLMLTFVYTMVSKLQNTKHIS